ncbi:hypothetical protein [Corynebacterium freiburgense]|nr:hypothetical protein [Corynebacterium freiburgense]
MNDSTLTDSQRESLAHAEIELLPENLFSLRGSWALLKDAFHEISHAA